MLPSCCCAFEYANIVQFNCWAQDVSYFAENVFVLEVSSFHITHVSCILNHG